MNCSGFFGKLKKDTPKERKKPQEPPVRKKLVFYGRVQGVGFRYEMTRMAKRLELVGWVKNEANFTVVAEVQGGAREISLLIQHMRSLRRANVTKVESTKLPPRKDEVDFIVTW